MKVHIHCMYRCRTSYHTNIAVKNGKETSTATKNQKKDIRVQASTTNTHHTHDGFEFGAVATVRSLLNLTKNMSIYMNLQELVELGANCQEVYKSFECCFPQNGDGLLQRLCDKQWNICQQTVYFCRKCCAQLIVNYKKKPNGNAIRWCCCLLSSRNVMLEN